MCGFEECVQKLFVFLAKNGRKWKNWSFLAKNLKTRIFFKNPLGTFFSLAKMQLCAKFQKNRMCGSPDIATRTDGRLHERESIGPSANAVRPKSELYKFF